MNWHRVIFYVCLKISPQKFFQSFWTNWIDKYTVCIYLICDRNEYKKSVQCLTLTINVYKKSRRDIYGPMNTPFSINSSWLLTGPWSQDSTVKISLRRPFFKTYSIMPLIQKWQFTCDLPYKNKNKKKKKIFVVLRCGITSTHCAVRLKNS
jgi:hypothetical protein